MFLHAQNLSGIPTVSHGFFTRRDGVSTGIYKSLNCGWGSNDDPEAILENRHRVAKALGTQVAHLCSLYQVHGTEVITVTEPWSRETLPKADAMVTATPGIALGILTADCVPVLLACAESKIIGAAHAGWRGAVAGVIASTVDAMETLGANRAKIAAAIGPSIAQGSYEVGADVKDAFLKSDSHNVAYFQPSPRGGHFQLDLKRYTRDRLMHAGLSDIAMLENDTYLEEDAFFSYRRATHRGEKDYGRQISAIMLIP